MNKDKRHTEEKEVKLIRILSKDIPGDKKLKVGLTLIKGISWSFANALCKKTGLDENKQIQELSPEEIETIISFVKTPTIPGFLKNRQKDIDSGEDKHLHGSDLTLQKDFDLKKMKKMKSYKGVRHTMGLPVRGQRTRSNFRRNKKKGGAVGVKKKGKR